MSTRRKNILFMITNLNVGGAEKLLVNLVNHLTETNFQ